MRPSRTRVGRAAASGAALVVVLAGCGTEAEAEDAGPSQDTVACRGQWQALGKQVQGNDQKTNPSALADRWNSVVATIDYYASTATADDCGRALAQQKDAIDELTAFGERLAPYDMELRLEQVRDDAEAYAEGPAPSATPTPKSKNQDKNKKKKQKKKAPPPPPSPAQVEAALKTFTTQAPLATDQQGPGWRQARVVELSDAAAVAKTVKDLRFLSTESSAYRACQVVIDRIRAALAAAGD